MTDLAHAFEENRAQLVRLAYRMLGDLGRAEDIVQDAWLRWQRVRELPESPKAFLATMVTRQCLNELDSARARREELRSNRLPEPIQLDEEANAVELADRISMAFLVTLQRLTPAERAVLLLHDVFDFEHEEIATLIEKSAPACRQLLRRARRHVAAERRSFSASRDQHHKLLHAFLAASRAGDLDALTRLLTADALFVADGGPGGVTVGGVRNVPHPVRGARRVAAVIVSLTRRGPANLVQRESLLNGQPAVVAFLDGQPVFAILLGVARDRIRRVFICADPARLAHVGSLQ
jgi:RNA polymerase sigma-70 factor (ECF subfamily)